MCGFVRERQANATRDFWPPDSRAIFWRPVMPVIPKLCVMEEWIVLVC